MSETKALEDQSPKPGFDNLKLNDLQTRSITLHIYLGNIYDACSS